MSVSVNDILNGLGLGRMQSVGHMGVIPIIDPGGASTDAFVPPDIEVGTSEYGTINMRNLNADGPTIVPTGAGWVTKHSSQDHAISGGVILAAGGKITINTAMCIEEEQGVHSQ